MNNSGSAFLIEKSRQIRKLTMDSIGKLGVGHVGGCLSVVEALVVLYYKEMNIDPENPGMEGRDRFVLSKGHAGPALYSVLADKGYFDVCLLDTLNRPETSLPSHCDMLKTRGIDMTAGSLGQGFSCAVGMAKGSKIKKDNATIYTIVGDGESQEGQIWEAAMFASQQRLNNLIGFTDYNKLQIDGSVEEVNGLDPLDLKWRAFGWNAIVVKDGHDVEEISAAISEAKKSDEKPTMIILNTIKGKGVKFAENAGAASHNMPVTEEQRLQALKELE
ncbi:transketolase [Anaerobacterium chartisolvens]|uniref:Transketolase n=1 Tax=Anaerobacterium chartisolvens TaxID=1297424 RepID=A0A369BHN9_9FIRM|nr:transketolase [Anaerobacterium chartisolvens]RCX20088.1 transketolase [Anaerobacterium chartisolvens]